MTKLDPAVMVSFSDEDLRDELERRARVREDHQAEERRVQAAKIAVNVETLLNFAQHARTSCSDENPENYDRGCTRCRLLQLRSYNSDSWAEDFKHAEITITLFPPMYKPDA